MKNIVQKLEKQLEKQLEKNEKLKEKSALINGELKEGVKEAKKIKSEIKKLQRKEEMTLNKERWLELGEFVDKELGEEKLFELLDDLNKKKEEIQDIPKEDDEHGE